MKGKLKHWNEEKGFGFISSNEEAKDVFIHITALNKMSRRPMVDDIITFKVHFDNNGKRRAINAQIEGVSPVVLRPKAYKNTSKLNDGWLISIIILVLIIIAGYGVSKDYLNSPPLFNKYSSASKEKIKSTNKVNFRCKGKIHCSEMSSCEEAKFYIKNCPGTRMDGDNDGVPCERQWCSSLWRF